MPHLLISGIPADTRISVFGMLEEQWTVDGDPAHTYYSGTPEEDEISIELKPQCAHVLIRAVNQSLRWRPDRRSMNLITGSYNDEWVSKVDGNLTFNLGDHLEPDPAMRERDIRPPAVVLDDLSVYEPFDIQTGLKSTIPPASNSSPRFPNTRKNIYAIIPSAVRKDIEHFRHSMPREVMWLLYGPLPFGNEKIELTFLYYQYGKPEGIDPEILANEAWRLDTANQAVLEDYRQRFIAKVEEWEGESSFLTHREIRNVSPRLIHEDYPLTLPDILQTGNIAPLWRYMDFAKFVSLIQTKSLWFARPSTFDDPFESKTNKSSRLKHLLRWMNRIVSDYNSAVYDDDEEYIATHKWWAADIAGEDGLISPLKFTTINDMPARLRFFSERSLDAALDAMLINCWHQNGSESDVMWRAYVGSRYGVVVLTSFDSLRGSFRAAGAQPSVLNVEYHDLHDENIVFDHLPSAYKHIAFKAEQEFRAYFPTGDLPDGSPGKPIPIELSTLIEGVITSPNAPKWFVNSVQGVLDQAGIAIKVQPSVFSYPLY